MRNGFLLCEKEVFFAYMENLGIDPSVDNFWENVVAGLDAEESDIISDFPGNDSEDTDT